MKNINRERQLEKQPLRNFIKIVLEGEFLEIPKILRRRTLNSFKAVRRFGFKIFGIYYDQPDVRRRRQRKGLQKLLLKPYEISKNNINNGLRAAIIARDGDTYPKSSAFIRLISPLTQETLGDKVHFKLYPENTTSIEADMSLCIIQRNSFNSPSTAQQLADNLKLLKIPLIIDTDDAFSLLDPSHPEHSLHAPTINAFKYIVSQADQVWVSTPRLKQFIGGRNTFVIPNALDKRVWKDGTRKTTTSGPIRMVYMGTVSHDADLEMILPALRKVADKFPGSFQLTVIGVSSELPDESWLQRVYQKNSIYPKFVEWFMRQGPFDIGLSPLVDSEFNRAKSDIKCLDYLAAGMLPVVSDIEPYQTKELDKYIVKVKNNAEHWEKTLAEIVKYPDDFRNRSALAVAAGQEYIWRERSSRQTAQQIYKQLQLLFPEL